MIESLSVWADQFGQMACSFVISFMLMGIFVWMLAIGVRFIIGNASPEIRHLAAVVSLACLAFVAVACGVEAGAGDAALRASESAAQILSHLWLAGIVAFASYLLLGLIATRRMCSRTRSECSARIALEVERLRKQLRLACRVNVCVSERSKVPILVGIRRPTIILPAAAAAWAADRLEHVLLHELAHVRRSDNLLRLLQRSIESVLWFHPAVWSLSRLIDEECEYCCDDLTLALTGTPAAYAETLIHLSETHRPALRPASAIGRKPIHIRLRRILSQQELAMTQPSIGDIVRLTLCCVVCFAVAEQPLPADNAASPLTANEPSPVLAEPIPSSQIAALDPPIAIIVPPPPQSRDFEGPRVVVSPGAKRNWGPEQVVGPPDTPEAGDQITAWASLSPDENDEWLVCEYAEAIDVKSIRVHETYNPGALFKLTAFDDAGNEVLAWEGEDPTPRDQPKGISVIPVRLDFPVKKIKLYIDSRAVPGWNEIDAVGLTDAEGTHHWAVKILASSTYAQPEAAPMSNPRGKRGWGPEQVTGQPDTLVAGDRQSAWASLSADGEAEWLICGFETPQRPNAIVVHENYNPGAVTKITYFDSEGVEQIAWEGVDPTPRDQPNGVSIFPVELKAPIDRIKIYIDSVAVPGWNEIDAVALRTGEDEYQWASSAEASSTYADVAVATPEPQVIVPAEMLQQLQQEVAALKEEVKELRELREEIKELKDLLKERSK